MRTRNNTNRREKPVEDCARQSSRSIRKRSLGDVLHHLGEAYKEMLSQRGEKYVIVNRTKPEYAETIQCTESPIGTTRKIDSSERINTKPQNAEHVNLLFSINSDYGISRRLGHDAMHERKSVNNFIINQR